MPLKDIPTFWKRNREIILKEDFLAKEYASALLEMIRRESNLNHSNKTKEVLHDLFLKIAEYAHPYEEKEEDETALPPQEDPPEIPELPPDTTIAPSSTFAQVLQKLNKNKSQQSEPKSSDPLEIIKKLKEIKKSLDNL